MWFSTLPYVTLVAACAATLQLEPISSCNIEESAHFFESNKIAEGWGTVKSLFDDPSKITDAIHEGFDSLSASAHTWYELHFPDTGESFWDNIRELGPNIKEYTDELFHHAVELYPYEKLTELRESMVNVTATVTVLRNVCSEAAEDNGVSFRSVIEEHEGIFVVLFEELMEMFPPPEQAPGHDNRTIVISTALDRFEEAFLQVVTELGVSEEQLKSHSSSLKFVVQDATITIGDLVEQHPDIANTLLLVVIAELLPLLLPDFGIDALFEGWLLRPLLRLLGLGPQGPIKGGIAAWLQRWIFVDTIPKGSWFAVLQRYTMVGSLTEKLGSLTASAHMLYGGLYFPDTGKSCWNKVADLGPNIQGCTDEFFQRAREFYPSDKITELRKSVNSVASTATTLYQVIKEAAEQRGIPLYTVSKDFGNTFRVLFEELKEQFPPPDEAPGHEQRMTVINTVLDRVEECFLQVVGKLGVSKELLTSLTGSLKSSIKHVVVTIGDANEQHPRLVRALLYIVISMLFAQGLLLTILRIIGFGPLGPMKGGIAAWLQGWLFGPAVPKGGWFAMLQRLAMIGGR